MYRFLRLFAYFRALEDELEKLRESHAQLEAEKLRLQDRLDHAREDRSQLWDVLRDCLRNERTAYQMHVNQSWQKMGGGIPYPEAPHLAAQAVPRQQEPEPIGRRRILPSEAIAMKTAEFVSALVKR